jgi:YHS domain-containing protein
MAVDPVCRKEISAQKSAGQVEHGGRKYYFCSRSCEKSFKAKPEHYISHEKKSGLQDIVQSRGSCDFTPF